MLAREVALPAGRRLPAPRLVGDVHVTAAVVGARDRALALALCARAGHGVLVRRSAAWVWSGEAELRPEHVDLARPPDGPPLPGRRPDVGPGLPVRLTRWEPAGTWTLLDGVPLTDPGRTAVECARSLPLRLARTCVEALAAAPGFDVAAALTEVRAGGARPGRRQAEDLLGSLPDQPLPGQPSTTSRCTPLVTR
ncbi:hypothetical protein [Jannaschia sp. R86511]|uniref:hypothetical protein n=1 Tax=Jannaschia sp. R86511 TaxID=3093853 RepID=UPI0036D23A03